MNQKDILLSRYSYAYIIKATLYVLTLLLFTTTHKSVNGIFDSGTT